MKDTRIIVILTLCLNCLYVRIDVVSSVMNDIDRYTTVHTWEERSDDKTAETVSEWASSIFEDVNYLTNIGNPLAVFAFGQHSFPVLLGATVNDALVVAAELGQGRIIVAGSMDYVNNAEPEVDAGNLIQFQDNVKKWLSRDAYTGSLQLCYITDVTDLSCFNDESVKVVVSAGTDGVATADADTRMLEWVEQGGGLFFAIAKQNPPIWTDIPFYNVLITAGIGLGDWRAKTVDDQFLPNMMSTVEDLRDLSMAYHSRTVTRVASLLTRSLYMEKMMAVITNEENPKYSLELRTAILSHLVPFMDAMQPQMAWPPCVEGEYMNANPAEINMLKLYTAMGFTGLWQMKAPNVEKFPGDVTDPPQERETITLSVNSRKRDYWTTGHYLLPGDEMIVSVTSAEVDDSWWTFTLLIGMHKDNLFKKHMDFRRFPITIRKLILTKKVSKISSPFGGIVVLMSPSSPAYIELTISGLVQAPQYTLDDQDSMDAWMERRLAPGPWAEMQGRYITIYLPSEGIRELDDPAPALRMFDNTVRESWDFVAIPEDRRRHMSLVPDLQISAGMMHSGYPIMGYLKVLGYPAMEKWPMKSHTTPTSHWGMFHEIGHNLQSRMWTFSGYVEVTVNVFSMHSYHKIGRTNPLLRKDWYAKQINKQAVLNVVNNQDYSILKSGEDKFTTLLLYAQLYVQFGWGCFTQVFATYEYDKVNNKQALPADNNNACIDQWVARWSHAIEYNLCPLFEFWAYPISICSTLSQYPAFLPLDDITGKDEVQARVEEIATTYPDLLRELQSKPECHTPTIMEEQTPEHIEVLLVQAMETTAALSEKVNSMMENLFIYNSSDNQVVTMVREMRENFEQVNDVGN